MLGISSIDACAARIAQQHHSLDPMYEGCPFAKDAAGG
jgi:hypothetical protein